MFKIGDCVTLKGANNNSYSSFNTMAEFMDLKNWKKGEEPEDGIEYKIVEKSFHPDSNGEVIVYAVDDGVLEFLVDGDCVFRKDELIPYEGYKFEYDKTFGCGLMAVFNKGKNVFGYNYKQDCPVVYPCDSRKIIDKSLIFLKKTTAFEQGKFYVDSEDMSTPFMVIDGKHHVVNGDLFGMEIDYSHGGDLFEIVYKNENTKIGKVL